MKFIDIPLHTAWDMAQQAPQLNDWLHGILRLKFNMFGGQTVIKPGLHKGLLTFRREF